MTWIMPSRMLPGGVYSGWEEDLGAAREDVNRLRDAL